MGCRGSGVDARGTAQRKLDGVLFVTNTGILVVGLVLSVLVAASSLAATVAQSLSPWIFGFETALFLIINYAFYKFLKAPTPEGRKVLDEIEGFRLYLSLAERERLGVLNPPEETPQLFEKYLPYALALDVDQSWAERFTGVLARATATGGPGYYPVWYYGTHWDARHPGRFTRVITTSLSGAIAAAANPPGSRSGAGSVGGFSGGGAGGGGGGGW